MTQFYDFFEWKKFIIIYLQDLYNMDSWNLDFSFTVIIQYNSFCHVRHQARCRKQAMYHLHV